MTNKTKKQIFFSVILYALPILFFIFSYFLLTTSGEDIWQGAGRFRTSATLNPLQDAINAFNFNSRITDMYAWAVIDFFDYQFSFGPDIIFRIIDVLMASATFYLATYIILGRKPKLFIKDALVFCATFALFIFAPFGRPFYHEFSMIHNYVPLALSTLLFSIPYLNLLRNQAPKKHLALLSIGMLLLGLYFGMAATITPLAFLLTIIIYCIIKRKSLKRPPLWFFTGIIGVVTGFLICWLAGSGVDHYTNPVTAAAFDYLPLNSLISTPSTAIPQLLWHEVYNFGIVLLPLLGIAALCILLSDNRRQLFTKKFFKSLPTSTKHYILVFSTFIIIHILGASLVKAPPRLLIPAYLTGLIQIGYIFVSHINSKIVATAIILFTTVILVIHTFFLIKYRLQTSVVLEELRQCNCINVCVKKERLAPPRIPVINLSQANMLVDWGAPEIIYDKSVTFCK